MSSVSSLTAIQTSGQLYNALTVSHYILTFNLRPNNVSNVDTTFSAEVELEPELAEFLDGDFPHVLAAWRK